MLPFCKNWEKPRVLGKNLLGAECRTNKVSPHLAQIGALTPTTLVEGEWSHHFAKPTREIPQ